MIPDQSGLDPRRAPCNAPRYAIGSEALRLALGEAFSATLRGVSESELDVKAALGERLLLELRKRGVSVTGVTQADGGSADDLHLSFEFG